MAANAAESPPGGDAGGASRAAHAEPVIASARSRIAPRIAEESLNYTMVPQQSLTQVRQSLLELHKALIERERAAYERGHGAVSAGEMLQLLIRDDAFSWLHPISELIVRVDELISNANERRRPTPARPAMTADQVKAEAEILMVETRELLTAGDAPGGFRERYDAVLQADPAIVLMHRAVMSALPSPARITH